MAGAPNITESRGTRPPLLSACLLGLCPCCGARTLFAGVAAFAPACRACGLRFDAFNVGDGPAALLILIVGGLIVTLVAIVEIGASPPVWVHALLWPPLATLLVVGALRVAKAGLLALEYRHEAGEGRRP